MEALVALGFAVAIFCLGLGLGYALGDGERQSLRDANEQLRGDILSATLSVRNARTVADALSHDDPRDRVRGLLDAGRFNRNVTPGPERHAGGAGGGMDLQRGNGDHAAGGPGADPPGPGGVDPGRDGPTG